LLPNLPIQNWYIFVAHLNHWVFISINNFLLTFDRLFSKKAFILTPIRIMKKLLFALSLGAAILLAPSCKKDDDNKDGDNNPPAPSLLGNWNFSEYSFNATSSFDFMGVSAQLEIDGQMISGGGSLSFLNDNTISATGSIVVETNTEVKAFGQVLFSDSETDNDDLADMFDGLTYELLPGSKVKMNIDEEEVIFDYVFGNNSVTLTGVVELEDDDLGEDPIPMNITIKLTK
jgi:hypothetical protein